MVNRRPFFSRVFFVTLVASFASLTWAKQADSDLQKISSDVVNCRDGAKIHSESWRISVPENRNKDESNKIKLAFIRFKSPDAQGRPPIFFLAGGPGGSGIKIIKRFVEGGGDRFFDLIGGDIIAIDQRGVGLSEPNLETDTLYGFSATVPGNREKLLERMRTVCRQEAAMWRSKGVDLAAYNTVESADDLNAIRMALGYERIALWGASYGTHLAMAMMRRHEEYISHALLEGPEGPNHTFKLPRQSEVVLEQISNLVAKDNRLGKHIPDMRAMLTEVLQRLENAPVYVDIDGQQVGVSKFDIQVLIAMKVGTINGSGDKIPALVKELFDGKFDLVARELVKLRATDGIYSAMSMMMDCSSGMTQERSQLIEQQSPNCLLGDTANWPTPYLAEAWGAKDLGDQFRSPLKSRIPVLFVCGNMDSRTPVGNAEELMKEFTNSHLVVVNNVGHNDLPMGMPELRTIWGRFLSTGKAASTTLTAPQIRFAMPRGVAIKKPNEAIDLSPEKLEKFVGDYRFESGIDFSIRAGEGRLIGTIPGKGDFDLWPKSKLDFFPEVSQLPPIIFEEDKAGNVVSFSGGGKTAKRIRSNASLNFIELPPEELDFFVGHYHVGDQGSFRIHRRGKKLYAQYAGQAELEIRPVSSRVVQWIAVDARMVFETGFRTAVLSQNGRELHVKRRTLN